ncbi:uncharacterized protein LOC122787222 isoform X2 [Protopterus annectens]|uniref:uncharacterized protein LOC122787222 isoform X2 n=1 Tax=Protopterus annectens TaxID=7888 RepID=UPI001CF96EC1|nr:uncharacterized protein LOC122787222 isoform X2 [Protopterus annectens]
MMNTLKGRRPQPKLTPLPEGSISLNGFRGNAHEQSKFKNSNIRRAIKTYQKPKFAVESIACSWKKHVMHTLKDKEKATLSEQQDILHNMSNDLTTFETNNSPTVCQEGDSCTTSESTSSAIKEKVHKIMIDLRPVLAQVTQPCDSYEDWPPDPSEPEEHGHLKLKAFKTSGKHKEENPQNKNELEMLVRESVNEARSALPKLVIKQLKDSNPPCLPAAVRKDITQAQATEHGILPSIPNPNLHSMCSNSSVSLPRIILQQRHQNQLTDRGKLSDKGERQYLSLPLDLQITVPQLLQQVKENTSSKNHFLIAQVLRSLREGLWLDSSLTENHRNHSVVESLDRRLGRLDFGQNSKKMALECKGSRSTKSEFPDGFPREMRSVQLWTYLPKLHMKSNLIADHGTIWNSTA